MADVERRQFDEWQLLKWNKEGVAVNLWFRILYHVQRGPTLTATSWQNQGNETLTLEASEVARSWTRAHRENDFILYTLSQFTWTHPWIHSKLLLEKKKHTHSFISLINLYFISTSYIWFLLLLLQSMLSFLSLAGWNMENQKKKKKRRDYLNLSLKQRVLVWLFEKRQEFVNSMGGKKYQTVPDFLFVLSFFVYVYDNRFCIWVCKVAGLGRRIFVLFVLADWGRAWDPQLWEGQG